MAFSIGVSGVYRTSPRQWIGVSGVWRPALAMSIGVGGVWRAFYNLGAAGSVTAGLYLNSTTSFVQYAGYVNNIAGSSAGSISGATFPDGTRVIRELSNRDGANGIRVSIGGFTSNPLNSWLNSVTCNGVTVLAASASFIYTTSLGIGTWTWASSTFGMVNGGTYAYVAVPTNP